jgi:hypothetical protein
VKRTLIIVVLTCLASAALADDAEMPVYHIMDVAIARWKTMADFGVDYFDRTHLGQDFSQGFQSAYKAASKFPAYDDGSSDPFDYDVITSSQDGCPLKDIAISDRGRKGDVSDIMVTFRLWDCSDDKAMKKQVSELHFDVITESGRPVISDIHRVHDGVRDSLVREMQDIVKNGQ